MKEIGIVTSYVTLLALCYWFNWKPFGIFIAYLIEIIVLFIVYSIIRLKDQRERPEKYRKANPLLNVFFAMIPLLLVHFFIIGWMSNHIDPEQNFVYQNLILTKEVYYAFGSALILYILKAINISQNKERLAVFQENFLFQVLALTATNILGFIIVVGTGLQSLLAVLTIMVSIRIALEIYFSRKMKLI